MTQGGRWERLLKTMGLQGKSRRVVPESLVLKSPLVRQVDKQKLVVFHCPYSGPPLVLLINSPYFNRLCVKPSLLCFR